MMVRIWSTVGGMRVSGSEADVENLVMGAVQYSSVDCLDSALLMRDMRDVKGEKEKRDDEIGVGIGMWRENEWYVLVDVAVMNGSGGEEEERNMASAFSFRC